MGRWDDMKMGVFTIVTLEDEPIHISGGESSEKAIELLQRTIELLQEEKVEHEVTEEE